MVGISDENKPFRLFSSWHNLFFNTNGTLISHSSIIKFSKREKFILSTKFIYAFIGKKLFHFFFKVTCYSHKDENNRWLIKKAYEDYGKLMINYYTLQ